MQTKNEGVENDISWNGNQKKAVVAILTANKICFKMKTIINDIGHYITIKVSIQQKDKILVNIYTPNIETSKNIKPILTNLKRERDTNIIKWGTWIFLLHQWINHPDRKSVKK